MDNNSATEYGGAVYVEDSNPIAYCISKFEDSLWDKCFFQIYQLYEISHATPSNLTHAVTAYYNIYIHFYNNHAQIAGSAVYGGAMDICKILVDYETTTEVGTWFLRMYDILNIELVGNSISSDPFRVCPCENGIAAFQNLLEKCIQVNCSPLLLLQ